MLDIQSILEYISDGVSSGLERFSIGEDSVLDTKTGVEIHVYDDWFKLTRGGEVVATMQDFDAGVEQPVIWQIKQLISDPDVMEQKKQDHLIMIKERRKLLSELFESPEPIVNNEIVAESGTTKYSG